MINKYYKEIYVQYSSLGLKSLQPYSHTVAETSVSQGWG